MRVQVLFSDNVAEFDVKIDSLVSDVEELRKVLSRSVEIGKLFLPEEGDLTSFFESPNV